MPLIMNQLLDESNQNLINALFGAFSMAQNTYLPPETVRFYQNCQVDISTTLEMARIVRSIPAILTTFNWYKVKGNLIEVTHAQAYDQLKVSQAFMEHFEK